LICAKRSTDPVKRDSHARGNLPVLRIEREEQRCRMVRQHFDRRAACNFTCEPAICI
jgi:hypothetical protein